MKLKINGNLKFLRKRSESVLEIDDTVKTLISDMIETMNANKGIGLAAPQVGILKRVMVIKIDDKNLILINPIIIKKGKDKEVIEEGCLSIPERFMEIKRPVEIEAKATDIDGNELDLKLDNLPARIFQHEFDHLEGILILDRISLIQKIKNFIKRKR